MPLKDDNGQDVVEYAILASLIAFAAIVRMNTLPAMSTRCSEPPMRDTEVQKGSDHLPACNSHALRDSTVLQRGGFPDGS
jgi:hypothetical protein